MIRDIIRYFPFVTAVQTDRFGQLREIYEYWNSRINLVSRKDMDNFYIHHVLHSLSIAKIIRFLDGTSILDVGTGGGFPGIPLAIMFPGCKFFLLDSIGKKIKAVAGVAETLGLENVTVVRKRAEDETERFDFAVSRALMPIPGFVNLVTKNITPAGRNTLENGIIYLKGGDIDEEIRPFRNKVKIWNISNYFDEPYFETKKVIYIPVF